MSSDDHDKTRWKSHVTFVTHKHFKLTITFKQSCELSSAKSDITRDDSQRRFGAIIPRHEVVSNIS